MDWRAVYSNVFLTGIYRICISTFLFFSLSLIFLSFSLLFAKCLSFFQNADTGTRYSWIREIVGVLWGEESWEEGKKKVLICSHFFCCCFFLFVFYLFILCFYVSLIVQIFHHIFTTLFTFFHHEWSLHWFSSTISICFWSQKVGIS